MALAEFEAALMNFRFFILELRVVGEVIASVPRYARHSINNDRERGRLAQKVNRSSALA
jgi:hypothetical protein